MPCRIRRVMALAVAVAFMLPLQLAVPIGVAASTPTITAIAVGAAQNCALTSAGGVKCWGANGGGELGDGTTTDSSVPVDVLGLSSGVAAISAGDYHICALTTGGGVKCWGFGDELLPVDVPGLASGVTAISAGGDHTCALTRVGGVKCWGSNDSGELGDGTTTASLAPVDVTGLASGITAIAAGEFHSCAITSLGGVTCWGSNSTVPVDVPGNGSRFTAIAAGYSDTCAITSGGGVKCWGDRTGSRSPVDVPGLASGVTAIADGSRHACALTSGGGVKCWGRNVVGELGDGSTTDSSVPVDVSGMASGVTAIDAGDGHTCALANGGRVKCWGADDNDQLGDAATSAFPIDVPGMANGVTAIAAGDSHSCAVLSEGGARCWGANGLGQLGDATTTQSSSPVAVSGPASGFRAITAGENYTCALTRAGGATCWGWNDRGQLGNGTTSDSPVPVDVAGLSSGVTAIAAGGGHTCALTQGGGVKCWGPNSSGQLGDGTATDSSVPVDVSGLTSGVTEIALGSGHTCALTSGGGVKCWGNNGLGQLGVGAAIEGSLIPVDVPGLSNGIADIEAGGGYTYVITRDARIKYWGGYSSGEKTFTDGAVPVDVPGAPSGVTALAVGYEHVCVLVLGGGVKCWGRGYEGELGNGTISGNGPVWGLTSGVIAIAAGSQHTCALTSGGGVRCWGQNFGGQLSNGATTEILVPVDVDFGRLALPPTDTADRGTPEAPADLPLLPLLAGLGAGIAMLIRRPTRAAAALRRPPHLVAVGKRRVS